MCVNMKGRIGEWGISPLYESRRVCLPSIRTLLLSDGTGLETRQRKLAGSRPPIGAPLNIHNPCLSYHGQYSKGWLSFFKRLSRCPFFSFPSVFTHALISPTTCTYIEQGCQKVQYAVTESSLGEVDTILAIERDMRGSLYLHCTADCFFHLFAVIHCNAEHESSSHR